jgi:hypothetical protein
MDLLQAIELRLLISFVTTVQVKSSQLESRPK